MQLVRGSEVRFKRELREPPRVQMRRPDTAAVPPSPGFGVRPVVSSPPVDGGPALDPPPFGSPDPPALVAARSGSRWSGDGWLLYRSGSGRGPAAAGLLRSYGASQAGLVVRYLLAAGDRRAPQAHLRATRALDFAQSEAALGLSLRPLPRVPLRLLGEARVQRDAGRTRLRPAGGLVSEVPAIALPFGAEGEVYVQAGYVGGPDATPFFDAQASLDRKVVSAGPLEARLGAGAWAGGQEGATRLDVGPRASRRLPFGPASSRLALDWRFRVAGDARPGSGPALTFSAGF